MSKLYYESLTNYHSKILNGIKRRREKLILLQSNLKKMTNTTNISGEAADNVKSYIAEVHINGIIEDLLVVLQNYEEKMNIYVAGYEKVDGSYVFKYVDNELSKHMQEIKTTTGHYEDIMPRAIQIMNDVADVKETDALATITKSSSKAVVQLANMYGTTSSTKEVWHQYENQTVKQLAEIDGVLPTIKNLIAKYSDGKMPTMSEYTAGGFNQLAGSKFLSNMSEMVQFNSDWKATSDEANNQIGQYIKGQKEYNKKIKDQENQNRIDGFKSLVFDAAIMALTYFSVAETDGSSLAVIEATSPKWAEIGAEFYNGNRLTQDVDKMVSGKKNGENILEESFKKINSKYGSTIYELGNAFFSVSSSRGMYSEISAGKSVNKAFAKEVGNEMAKQAVNKAIDEKTNHSNNFEDKAFKYTIDGYLSKFIFRK